MNCNLTDMLSKNMNLVILVLYAYILMNHVGDKDYTSMVILTVATLMGICYLKKNGSMLLLEKPRRLTESFTADTDSETKVKQMDASKAASMPVRKLPSAMGPYDGLCLQTGNKEYWMSSPDNVQLVPNDALYAYLGSQGPLKPVFSDNTALTGPPIEGDASSDPKKMFILANNRTSSNCCPGTFSTSTGCVCTTEKQRDYIASRGNNKGDPTAYEDF